MVALSVILSHWHCRPLSRSTGRVIWCCHQAKDTFNHLVGLMLTSGKGHSSGCRTFCWIAAVARWPVFATGGASTAWACLWLLTNSRYDPRKLHGPRKRSWHLVNATELWVCTGERRGIAVIAISTYTVPYRLHLPTMQRNRAFKSKFWQVLCFHL